MDRHPPLVTGTGAILIGLFAGAALCATAALFFTAYVIPFFNAVN